MANTQIRITFSDLTVREYEVSDKVEEGIKRGEVLSFSTRHPSLSEMFVVTTEELQE